MISAEQPYDNRQNDNATAFSKMQTIPVKTHVITHISEFVTTAF